MACRLVGAKPLSEPVLKYCSLGTSFSEIEIKIHTLLFKKMQFENVACHFISASMLTHLGRDKMAAVSQTFSNAFSWMKMYEFRLKFHWSLFLRFQLTIFQHWFRYWFGAVQATSHYLNQWWLIYWCIYASLGLNELTHRGQNKMYSFLQTTFSWIKKNLISI